MPPNTDDHFNVSAVPSDMVPDAMVHDLRDAKQLGAVAVQTTELPTTPNTETSANDSTADGDQCIVCLEVLTVVSEPNVEDLQDAGQRAITNNQLSTTHPGQQEKQPPIALIKPCGHVLHDDCLRLWSQKANSCPICRQSFNLVEVLDKVDGKSSSLPRTRICLLCKIASHSVRIPLFICPQILSSALLC